MSKGEWFPWEVAALRREGAELLAQLAELPDDAKIALRSLDGKRMYDFTTVGELRERVVAANAKLAP